MVFIKYASEESEDPVADNVYFFDKVSHMPSEKYCVEIIYAVIIEQKKLIQLFLIQKHGEKPIPEIKVCY